MTLMNIKVIYDNFCHFYDQLLDIDIHGKSIVAHKKASFWHHVIQFVHKIMVVVKIFQTCFERIEKYFNIILFA